MLNLKSRPGFQAFRLFAAAFVLAGLCGCATLTFKPIRESHFVDMDAVFLIVEYGQEKRTETMANGLVCTFEGKVRVRLPDGKRVVLYQAMTTTGVRYVSSDKRYEFIERGPYCVMLDQGRPCFEGVFCRK